MALALFLLLLPPLSPPQVEMRLDPRPGPEFTLILDGPSGAGSGEFRGRVSLNGSPSELPLSGRAESSGGRLRVAATARYTDVPADWLGRFRPGSFDYAVRGEVAGKEVSWSGTMRWSEVPVAGEGLASRFLRLGSLELTALSPKRTEGRGVLNVSNPFSFPVRLSAGTFRIRVNGEEIGGGGARERVARGKRTTGVELPFSAEERRFLAAAGDRWAVGAPVRADLSGSLTLRLPSGDVSIPLDFSTTMGTDGARSGVFSHPDGGSSLSPH
jgi:hypothetical protein